jgi:hypothetical protein
MTACVVQFLHFAIKNLLCTINRHGCKNHQLAARSLTNWGDWLQLTIREVAVITFNSHNTTFTSWHVFTRENALRLFKNSHNTKFCVVPFSQMPQRVVVVFSAQWAFSNFELNLCTVLLTVRLAARKSKLLTELVAVPNLTLTDHTEFKELNPWWLVFPACAVELSADSVLCCFVIRSSGAE